MVLIAAVACLALIFNPGYLERFQNLGYPSAFIFGFLAGLSLPIAAPYAVVTFTLGGVMNPGLVGLASGVGAGLGGSLVYFLGSGGGRMLSRYGIYAPNISPGKTGAAQRFLGRLQRLTHRRGSLVVFLMSVIINPVFAPMAVTIGAMRYGFWRFLLWCTLGNIAKSMAIAYCGYLGLKSLLKYLGQ